MLATLTTLPVSPSLYLGNPMDPPDVVGVDLGDARPTQLPGRAKSKRADVLLMFELPFNLKSLLHAVQRERSRLISRHCFFSLLLSSSLWWVLLSPPPPPEEPPPRPPQPAVLMKSKSPSPQQLLPSLFPPSPSPQRYTCVCPPLIPLFPHHSFFPGAKICGDLK